MISHALFCTEKESIHHLFFECVVSMRAWELFSQAVKVQNGNNFEFLAKLWLCNKKKWCYQCDHFSNVLEYLETEELYLFPMCCLARDENALTTSSADAKILEDFNPPRRRMASTMQSLL
jgi:hypothetical protein